MIRAVCICLPEYPDAIVAAQKHFEEAGISPEWMWSVNAEVAGLATSHCYNVDHPGTNFRMGTKPTGIWLAHIMVWTLIMSYPDEHVLVLETDAKFQEGWKEKYEQAMKDAPTNFDFLHLGHCAMEGHPRTHVAGDVWETKHCLCTHAYIVRRACLPFVLRTVRKCYAPIDCQLVLEVFPHLLTYAVYPRCIDQFNTILPP